MYETELWVTVKDYPMYEVSNLGEVRSWHGKGRTEVAEEPITLKAYFDEQGYKRVSLARPEDKGKKDCRYVHRLMAEAFIGPVEGLMVRHLNDNPQDNRLENLALGTQEDNMADKKANGNGSWTRKLTFDEAEQIRQRYADGETLKAIHADFQQVSYRVLRKIVNGVAYLTDTSDAA